MSRLHSVLRRLLTPAVGRAGGGGAGGRRLYSATPSINIREARQEDDEVIMDITHGIYGDRDYLPSLYSSFVRNPDIHCYVYELDGHVVGFEAAHVVDGGKTIVTRGARVREECQGHGVLKSLRKHIVDKLASDHTIKCISMTTSNTTGLAIKPSVAKTNKIILQRDVHVFPYEVKKIQVPEKDDFVATPTFAMSTKQLCDTFSKPEVRSYLFPHDRIIINTVPFRLMPENAEAMQMENPYIIMSEKVLKYKTAPTDGVISMTTWFSCQAGICVDLEFYGLTSNFPEVCNHIGHHLRHIHHLATHGHIMVPHSNTISKDVLLCVMSRYGLLPAVSPFKTQYLFEEYLEDSDTSAKRVSG